MNDEMQLTNRITSVDTRVQILENEVASLREDRHKQGTALQVHELEIGLLKQAVSGGHGVRIDKLEAASEFHSKEIAEMRSDIRLLVWRVGALSGGISGGLFFVLNYIVNHVIK